MGPTRIRDLAVAALVTAVAGYLAVHLLYRYFPPITGWTGLSLLAIAAVEFSWGLSIRSRIRAGRIGLGGGRLHPLVVARTLAIAKASMWAGALILGWWVAVLGYLLPQQDELRVAAADTPGALIAAGSALALVVAAYMLQHCCKSPGETSGDDALADNP